MRFSRLFFGMCILLGGSACGQHNEATGSIAAPVATARLPPGVSLREASRLYVTVTPVVPQGYDAVIQAPVKLEFRTEARATVGAVVAGRLGAITVHVGDKVKAGTVLATLSSIQAAQMRAEFARANAELQRAESLVQRQRAMRQAGVGIELEMLEATAQLHSARAEYERTQQSTRLF